MTAKNTRPSIPYRYFTVYEMGCLQTWYLVLVELAPGFEPLVLQYPLKTKRSSEVSWAIQTRLITFNVSDFYTAHRTHCTENSWFKHRNFPDLCNKTLPQCVLNNFIRLPGRTSTEYIVLLSFFMIPWAYISFWCDALFVFWSCIPSGFFLFLSSQAYFKDGISKRALVRQNATTSTER